MVLPFHAGPIFLRALGKAFEMLYLRHHRFAPAPWEEAHGLEGSMLYRSPTAVILQQAHLQSQVWLA